MNPGKIETGYVTPVPSTEIFPGVSLEAHGISLGIRLTYGRGGKVAQSGLEFDGVRAYRCRAAGECTEWHIEDAFDTLVEVLDSAWLAELAAVASFPEDYEGMHHFMIYLHNDGCYEIAAKTWTASPEVETGGVTVSYTLSECHSEADNPP